MTGEAHPSGIYGKKYVRWGLRCALVHVNELALDIEVVLVALERGLVTPDEAVALMSMSPVHRILPFLLDDEWVASRSNDASNSSAPPVRP
jgi:hypothetical protein